MMSWIYIHVDPLIESSDFVVIICNFLAIPDYTQRLDTSTRRKLRRLFTKHSSINSNPQNFILLLTLYKNNRKP